MLLVEQLLADPVFPATRAGVLQQAVVVRVDNIARWYGEISPQAVWQLNADFPNVAPPWPVAFYEYSFPRYLNRSGVLEHSPYPNARQGVLVQSTQLDTWVDTVMHTDEHMLSYFWGAVLRRLVQDGDHDTLGKILQKGPVEAWRSLPSDAQQQWRHMLDELANEYRQAGVGWICQATVVPHVPPKRPVAVSMIEYPVLLDGRFLESISKPGHVAYLVCPLTEQADLVPGIITEMGPEPLHIPALAMSFCHCKNVVLRDEVPPPKLSAKQEKRHGVPKVTYKTLEIQPMLGVLEREGGAGRGHTAQQALHICRGHFADYREHGLFGKHKGIFWFDMHVRGHNRQGVVIKDYAVSPPSPTQPDIFG